MSEFFTKYGNTLGTVKYSVVLYREEKLVITGLRDAVTIIPLSQPGAILQK